VTVSRQNEKSQRAVIETQIDHRTLRVHESSRELLGFNSPTLSQKEEQKIDLIDGRFFVSSCLSFFLSSLVAHRAS
jgi:hypothetical protein